MVADGEGRGELCVASQGATNEVKEAETDLDWTAQLSTRRRWKRGQRWREKPSLFTPHRLRLARKSTPHGSSRTAPPSSSDHHLTAPSPDAVHCAAPHWSHCAVGLLIAALVVTKALILGCRPIACPLNPLPAIPTSSTSTRLFRYHGHLVPLCLGFLGLLLTSHHLLLCPHAAPQVADAAQGRARGSY